MLLRDEKKEWVKFGQNREKQKREGKQKREAGTPKPLFWFRSFLRDFFPSFYSFCCVSDENNYISSKLYLFIIKERAHHHNTGVLLRDSNKHTHTPRSISSLSRARATTTKEYQQLKRIYPHSESSEKKILQFLTENHERSHQRKKNSREEEEQKE